MWIVGWLSGFAFGAPLATEITHQADEVLDSIGATPAQRAELRQIAAGALDDVQQHLPAARQLAGDVADAVTGRVVDRDALEGARKDAVEWVDRASADLLPRAADAADVLTPAQRRALVERARRELDRWGVPLS